MTVSTNPGGLWTTPDAEAFIDRFPEGSCADSLGLHRSASAFAAQVYRGWAKFVEHFDSDDGSYFASPVLTTHWAAGASVQINRGVADVKQPSSSKSVGPYFYFHTGSARS